MKRIHLLFLLGLASLSAYSQTVRIEFPFHSEKTCVLHLKNGTTQDTIFSGLLTNKGIADIAIPKEFAGYAGMASLNMENGSGVDFIVNNENLTLKCSEEYPHGGNVTFIHSPENTALQTWFNEQAMRQQKIGALAQVEQMYHLQTAKEGFTVELKKEIESLQAKQEEFETILDNSPLYTAKFLKFHTFLSKDVAGLVYGDSTQMANVRAFVIDKLDAESLYTSGLWFETLNGLLALYDNKAPYHADFVDDMSKVMKRIQSNKVYMAMAENLFAICVATGWNDLEEKLAYSVINDGRIENPTGRLKLLLSLFKVAKGSQAPELTQIALPKSKILLVFYESGCGPCENEMQQLKGNYPLLQEKGIELISFSADTDADIFKNTSNDFPWEDKLCDLKGFKSPDFQNYGVIGTPTYYLIDSKGIIQGRYARLADTGLLNIEK